MRLLDQKWRVVYHNWGQEYQYQFPKSQFPQCKAKRTTWHWTHWGSCYWRMWLNLEDCIFSHGWWTHLIFNMEGDSVFLILMSKQICPVAPKIETMESCRGRQTWPLTQRETLCVSSWTVCYILENKLSCLTHKVFRSKRNPWRVISWPKMEVIKNEWVSSIQGPSFYILDFPKFCWEFLH